MKKATQRKKLNKSTGVTPAPTSLGKKRMCPHCGAKFYDFEKEELDCPKCDQVLTQEDFERAKSQNPPVAKAVIPDPEEEETDSDSEGVTTESDDDDFASEFSSEEDADENDDFDADDQDDEEDEDEDEEDDDDYLSEFSDDDEEEDEDFDEDDD